MCDMGEIEMLQNDEGLMTKVRRQLLRRGTLLIVGVLLTAAILALDLNQSLDGAVAVLYAAVVVLIAPAGRRYVLASGVGGVFLACAAFAIMHMDSPSEGAISRLTVSLVAIGITTLLSMRDTAIRTTLGEQARILELSQDTVIIRAKGDVIVHWNEGAERLYGWTRDEALGRQCTELLECTFSEAEVSAALESVGHWSGEIARTRRDGTRLVLATRWLLRRDPEGRAVGVIESSSDLTERRRLDSDRQTSEGRYRTIFDNAGFAMWESDWSETVGMVARSMPPNNVRTWLAGDPSLVESAVKAAVIRNANPAAAALFGAQSREALAGTNICGRYLSGEHVDSNLRAFAIIVAALAEGDALAEGELRLLTFDGRTVDVILRVTLLPEGNNWSHVLVMALDVTERNEARSRFEHVTAELAHAGRVSTLGQLAASIAHEVNQPLTAIINYAKSGTRWLGREAPRLDEVSKCFDSIVSNGSRAAEVISRVRGLARKAEPQFEAVDLMELIENALAITLREATAKRAHLTWDRPNDLVPPVRADRVQIQQVLVNLIINGVQSMAAARGIDRQLWVELRCGGGAAVEVSVRDSGAGFANNDATRLFEPFFTTKPDGMGMGLSICRSIVEAAGGRIWAQNNEGPGATVSFSLPAYKAGEAAAETHI
jgi:PAS domain S-box-containing protein